jgi:RNA polymerase sigma-70 factor, ECF subfamily
MGSELPTLPDDRTNISVMREYFDAQFARVQPKITSIVSAAFDRRGNQYVEEFVQDIAVRAWKGLPRFNGEAQFSTWVYAITKNTIRNKFRFLGARFTDGIPLYTHNADGDEQQLQLPDPNVLTPAKTAEFEIIKALIENEIDHLPGHMRDAYVLRYFQNMEYGEIASTLGRKLGTVKSQIARARERLREKYGRLSRISDGFVPVTAETRFKIPKHLHYGDSTFAVIDDMGWLSRTVNLARKSLERRLGEVAVTGDDIGPQSELICQEQADGTVYYFRQLPGFNAKLAINPNYDRLNRTISLEDAIFAYSSLLPQSMQNPDGWQTYIDSGILRTKGSSNRPYFHLLDALAQTLSRRKFLVDNYDKIAQRIHTDPEVVEMATAIWHDKMVSAGLLQQLCPTNDVFDTYAIKDEGKIADFIRARLPQTYSFWNPNELDKDKLTKQYNEHVA